MNDDWRLQVELHDESLFDPVVERLEARELADDLSEAFHDRVIVSRNGAELFLYAGTRDQAERARVLLDEDHAKALAERIRSEAPAGSRVAVEGTWQAALAEQPPNPFAIFGGLGA